MLDGEFRNDRRAEVRVLWVVVLVLLWMGVAGSPGVAVAAESEAGAGPVLPWDQAKVLAAATRFFAEVRNLRESAAGTRENLDDKERDARRSVLEGLLELQNLARLLQSQLNSGANRNQTIETYRDIRAGRQQLLQDGGARERSEVQPYLLVGLSKLDSALARLSAFYPDSPTPKTKK